MKIKFTLLLFLIPFVGSTQWTILGNTIDGVVQNDKIGSSNTMSIDSAGTTLAVGSPYNSDFGSYSGYVKVFDLVTGAWVQRGNTFIGNDSLLEGTGSAVSLTANGNTIAIGSSHGHNSLGYRCGVVRVFDWDGSNWIQRGATIEGEGNPNPLFETDVFGISVSITPDGNYLAVGAPGNTQQVGVLQLQGHARVYHWDGQVWQQVGQDIDGIQSLEDFGRTVSINADGNILAVGGRDYGFPQDSGIVRTYIFDGTQWQARGSFLLGPEANCAFGTSVALSRSGNTLVVGAPKYSNFTGGAFVYDWQNTSWVQRGTTILGSSNSRAGSSVDINGNGNILAIGEPWKNSANGGAHVMGWFGSSWAPIENFITGLGSTSAINAFGSSVAIDDWGAKIAVGASNHDAISYNEGKVYVFVNQAVIPSADFNPDPAACMNNITFTDASTAMGTVSWMWDFGPNATPNAAVGVGPHVVSYSSSATQTVTLTVSNAAGSDISTMTINPVPVPTASFTYQASGVLVDFTNTSTSATAYSWIFDGSNQSTAVDPSFNFTVPGTYTVTLTASNACGTDTFSEDLVVEFPAGNNELSTDGLSAIRIYPNPTQGQFTIDVPETLGSTSSFVELYNTLGERVYSSSVEYSNRNILLPDLAKGVYVIMVRFPREGQTFTNRLTIY